MTIINPQEQIVGPVITHGPIRTQATAPLQKYVGMFWYDTSQDRSTTLGVKAIRTITEDYSALNTDEVILADATAGNIIITLPFASDDVGKIFEIKKINIINSVTIEGIYSELIDADLNKIIGIQYNSISIISDGTQWWIL